MSIGGLPPWLTSGISNAELGELANLVKGGMSVGEAMSKMGIQSKISEATARTLLKRQGIQLVRQASGWGIQATARAGRWGIQGLGRVGGIIAGASAGFWVALGIGVVALGVGGYLYSRGESPVQFGSRMLNPKATTVPSVTSGSASQPYAVFVLTNISGGSVWVGQEANLKNAITCNFWGGGLCADAGGQDVPVAYIKKTQDFNTIDQATQSWCNELSGKPIQDWTAVTGDKKAGVYGGMYWIGLAPSCP
jgi:hypothetical protein